MTAEHYRKLINYNYWAHQRVWECVLKLSEEQFKRPCDYSIGSVHDQIVHTMAAEWLWLQRLNGTSPESLFDSADYPTRESIRAKWDTVEADWRAFMDALRDDQLEETLHYTSISGRAPRQNAIWQVLSHILNHSTDHRSQTLAVIHQVGGETIAQDLIFYAWNE
jgi:uncharacterized damage-inducible protein DinB